MDLQALLTEARAYAGLSQSALAARSGVARAALNGYERGHRSTTLDQLDRLLEACGLRLRAGLEPRTATEDAVLDAAERTPPLDELEVSSLFHLGDALTAEGVRWAADRHTALSLHGLHLPQPALAAVLQDGLATRVWLGINGVRSTGPYCDVPWPERTDEQAADALRFLTLSRYGYRWFRLDPHLPEPVLVQAAGRTVPVLPLHELERQDAATAALLHRWRERRAT